MLRSKLTLCLGLAVVFVLLLPPVRAFAEATETTLYNFTCDIGACFPSGPLARDKAGNIYGTTAAGGGNFKCAGGCGTVFELSPDSQGTWSETTLYAFQGGTDGSGPTSGVILDAAGNLYGTTFQGGSSTCKTGEKGCGTVFELSPNGDGSWTEMILYRFTGGADGAGPYGGLVLDGGGNLYGTTESGGGHHKANCSYGCGVAFQLSSSSGRWTETVLSNFGVTSTDGIFPSSTMAFDDNGNLYGTTQSGGLYCGAGFCGTAFRISHSSGTWVRGTIWNFTGLDEGGSPSGILWRTGSLYGTTQYGGANGIGTIFQMSPAFGNWNLGTLYNFKGGNDGAYPEASLTADAEGNLYGTTRLGGNYELGTVFVFTPSEEEKAVYSFKGGSDGLYPTNPVLVMSGRLYGTNQGTIAPGYGLIYQITP